MFFNPPSLKLSGLLGAEPPAPFVPKFNWDPNYQEPIYTFSENDTLASQTGSTTNFSPFFLTTQALPVGKWYFEFQYTGVDPGSSAYISVIPGDRRSRYTEVGSSGLNDSGVSWRSDGFIRNQFGSNTNETAWPVNRRMGYEVEVFANGSAKFDLRSGNGGAALDSIALAAAGSFSTGAYIAGATAGPTRSIKLLERTEDFLYTPTAGYLPLNDVPSAGYRYWRVNCVGGRAGSNTCLNEVQFSDASGVDLTSPAESTDRTFASSGFVPSNAFNDEILAGSPSGLSDPVWDDTGDLGWNAMSADTNPWLAWDFGLAKEVREVLVITRGDVLAPTGDFTVEGSNDSVTWDVLYREDVTGWASREIKTFTPTYPYVPE